ncbi:ABC transporter substrate-binding protein [Nocardiopsis nanhaiensis]
MNKGLRLTAACGAVVLVSTGCGGFGGDTEVISFYSPETPDMTQEMADAFMEEHDYTVEVNYSGTNELVNQMIAESDNPQGDLWYGGGGWMPFENALDQGIIEPYTPTTVEDMDAMQGDIALREEDWGWTGAELFVLGLAYNPDEVSEDELPQTWADLADDRWAGELQFPNPAASGTATLLVLSQLMEMGEEEGWEYLETLADHATAIPDSGGAPTEAVTTGEANIAVGYDFMAYQHEDRGESVDFHIPEETPVLVNPVAMVTDGPNPEGAEEFIDWMLSTEGQQIRADWFHIPLDDEVESRTPITLDQVEDHAQDLDVDWVVDNYDDARDEWNERIG